MFYLCVFSVSNLIFGLIVNTIITKLKNAIHLHQDSESEDLHIDNAIATTELQNRTTLSETFGPSNIRSTIDAET